MQQVYDNSPCHTSITEQFVVKKQIITIAQPLYYPDHPLRNFWLFPTFTTEIKGHNFASKEEI